MGNTITKGYPFQWDSKIIEIDFTNDAIAINYDTNMENVPVSVSDNIFVKTYIVYYCVNGMPKTSILTIKMMKNNIFIYVTDMYTKKATLAHVANINNNCVNENIQDNQDNQYIQENTKYMKYIQVSQDFQLISLPDNNTLHLYDLRKLIESNILEYVDTIGSFDKIMSDQSNPYKCILFNNIYVILYNKNNTQNHNIRNNGILIINYDQQRITNVAFNNLWDNIMIRLSTNGYYCVMYDKIMKNISICNFKSENPSFTLININININNEHNKSDNIGNIDNINKIDAINISNDGKLIFMIMNNTCVFYDTQKTKIIKVFQNQSKGLTYQLLDYSEIIHEGITNISKIHILVGWNQSRGEIYYWHINYTIKEEYEMFGPFYLRFKISGTLEYICNNNDLYIYKTKDKLTVYDLKKVIQLRFIEILRRDVKKGLDQYISSLSHKKYNKIRLFAADETIMEYETNGDIQYMIAESKDNMFKVRVNANMSLYDNKKSFQIYQGLLTETINYDDILDGIFSINMVTGIHNMMCELMDHMYEFTRVIGLGETQDGNITRSKINNLKALYIGYVLLLLVLKYYSKLYMYITKDDKAQYDQIHYNLMYHDLIETFIENFPAFEGFIKKTYIYSSFDKRKKIKQVL